MTELLDEVIATAFPTGEVRAVETLAGTSESDVARVRFGDDAYVVKLAPTTSATENLHREVAVTNYVQRTGSVPVVEFRDVVLESDAGPAPFYVAPWADGPNLGTLLDTMPLPRVCTLFERLGETLAALHESTTFESPGTIEPVDETSFDVQPRGRWSTMFATELATTVETLSGTRFEQLAATVSEHVGDRLRTLDTPTPPVLLHGDIGDGNVVYEDGQVSRLLDWERAFVGHPEYDLCRAETRYFWNSWGALQEPQTAFYEGYRSGRALDSAFEDRRRCYLATFSLSPLQTFDQWAPRFGGDADTLADALSRRIRGILP